MKWFIVAALIYLAAQEECKEPQYTECSEHNERWRVWVGDNCSARDPVRVADCNIVCGPGQHLADMTNCKKCSVGTYSTGNKLEYPVFGPSQLHPEITASSSKIDLSDNQPCYNWKVVGKEAVSPVDSCWAELSVPFTLVTPGTVVIQYIYPDNRLTLNFMVKQLSGGSCTSANSIAKGDGVPGNQWNTIRLKVSEVGKLLLQIKSTSFLNANTLNKLPIEPVRVTLVSIEGVKPPTQCLKCSAGYYSNTTQTPACLPCAPGSYTAAAGSTQCTACSATQYSVKAAAACTEQVTCAKEDLVPAVSQCNSGSASLSYSPAISNKCTAASVPGPQSVPCLSCQPGMEYKDDKCSYCPPGKHSQMGAVCRPCPANNNALKGLYYVWWGPLLPFKTDCPSCWLPAGATLQGRVTSSVSTLDLGLVKFADSSLQGDVVGIFTVKFDLRCDGECSVMFVEYNTVVEEQVTVIREYTDSVDNSVFLVKVKQQADNTRHYSIRLSNAEVDIMSVNFTNTVEGGASYCYPCSGGSCTDCQPGMIADGAECVECPANTYQYTEGSLLYSNYTTQCKQCPEGTVSEQGSTSCYVQCNTVTVNSTQYNWSKLNDMLSYDKLSTYTDTVTGQTFHNRYKMKLCTAGPVPTVECGSAHSSVTSQLCGETVVTDRKGNTTIKQPISLGERMVSVTAGADSVTVSYTAQPTTACETGVSSSVIVRCNVHSVKDLMLITQRQCRYEFEVTGPFGCRQCTESDYRSITSQCDKGLKSTTHVWSVGVRCVGGAALPTDSEDTCTAYEDSVVNTIKKYKLYFGLGFLALVILIIALCLLLWYSSTLRHRLEGYSKLGYAEQDERGSGNGLNGAPPPFHWEDEEDEEEDLYSNPQFRYKAPSPGAMLLQKLNSLTPKLKSSLTPRKYKNLDIIDMSEQEHLGDI